jgi:solute:Na+ symporter, SSS family
MAKIVSLIIKYGALVFILGLPLQYAIQLQLLGGVWIIQTLPAVIGGLYTRWFHDRALVLGWLAGIVVGTAMAASQSFRPIYPLQIGGLTIPTYAALASLILNLIVVIVLTRSSTRSTPYAARTRPAPNTMCERKLSI